MRHLIWMIIASGQFVQHLILQLEVIPLKGKKDGAFVYEVNGLKK